MKRILSTDQWNNLEYLKYSFEIGLITGQEASDVLEKYIDEELRKNDVLINNDWLDACIELMKMVDASKLSNLPNHSKENLRNIRKALVQPCSTAHSYGQRTRVISAIACVCLMVFGVSITWRGIEAHQSVDEQVYSLTGEEVHVGFDSSANAENDSGYQEYETADFRVLCSYLGYTPQIPTWIPEDWTLYSYYVAKDSESSTIDVVYTKENEQYILGYTHTQTDAVTNISVDFFQDFTGIYRTLGGIPKVYITTNMDHLVAVWFDSDSYFCISGPITMNDVEKMILSINREEDII